MPPARPQPEMLVGMRSRKHIMPFDLVRPATPEEACAAMTASGRNVYMAGGLDLIDRMKRGEAFDRVIRLDGIAAMHGIHRTDAAITIGALTTHAEIARSDVLADAVPGLPALWRAIANPRVRHAGTIERHPEVPVAAMRAIIATHAALKDDISLATQAARRLFPAEEAALIAELVSRDLPYYDAVLAPETIARDVGILDGHPAYADVVAGTRPVLAASAAHTVMP